MIEMRQRANNNYTDRGGVYGEQWDTKYFDAIENITELESEVIYLAIKKATKTKRGMNLYVRVFGVRGGFCGDTFGPLYCITRSVSILTSLPLFIVGGWPAIKLTFVGIVSDDEKDVKIAVKAYLKKDCKIIYI